MADLERAVKNLDRLAKKLIDIVPTKRIKVAICGDKPVLIFQPTPRLMPADALSALAIVLKEEGLAPVFTEKDDNLIVAYVKPESVGACKQVRERESEIPEQLLKIEYDTDCIKLLTQLFKPTRGIGSYYMLIVKKAGCEACQKLDEELYGEHLGLEGAELALLINAFDNVIEVDSDKCKSIPTIFKLSGYPAFILFKNGKPIDKKEGWGEEVKRWLIQRLFEISQAKEFQSAKLEKIRE